MIRTLFNKLSIIIFLITVVGCSSNIKYRIGVSSDNEQSCVDETSFINQETPNQPIDVHCEIITKQPSSRGSLSQSINKDKDQGINIDNSSSHTNAKHQVDYTSNDDTFLNKDQNELESQSKGGNVTKAPNAIRVISKGGSIHSTDVDSGCCFLSSCRKCLSASCSCLGKLCLCCITWLCD